MEIQTNNRNGWFPIIAAVLMLSFWILFAVFLPMKEEYVNWVLDDDWTWINIIGFIGSAFGIFALQAIFSTIKGKNTVDRILFGTGVIGIVILTSLLFFETFILKGIALQNPELIDLNGSFYQYPIFKLANLLGGILLSISFFGLGVRMIILSTFKKWKLILLMIACPLFGIVIMPGNLRLLGVLLYAVSLIAIGIEMIKDTNTNKT